MSPSSDPEPDRGGGVPIDRLPKPYQSLDGEGRLLAINDAWLDLLGYERTDVIGEPFADFLVAEDRETFHEEFDRLLERGTAKDLEYGLRDADGDLVRVAFDGRVDYDREGTLRRTHCQFHDVTERVTAARELRTLADNLPGIAYRCRHEPGWPMEIVRGRSEALTGYPAESLESGAVSYGGDVIHPEDREWVAAAVERGREQDEEFEVTYRILTEDGEVKWVWERGGFVDVPGLSEPRIEGFITDVTERKHLEEELTASKERYLALFHSISDPILVADTERRIVNCNRAFTERFGYDLEDVKGEPTALVYAESAEYEEVSERIDATDEHVRVTDYETADGAVFPGETTISAFRDREGALRGYIGVIRDVSERQDRQRELRRFETIIEGATDMLAAAAPDGTLLVANEQYRKFHGLAAEDVGSVTIDSYLEKGYETVEDHFERALQGEQIRFTMERSAATGTERIFDVLYYPLETTTGIDVVVASFRDITERREREQEIERLAEYRRVMSEVNQRLVAGKDPELVLPLSATIIASSDRFACSFLALLDEDEVEFVCEANSGLDESTIAEIHTPEYRRRLKEEGVFHIEDVTEAPFEQHVDDQPAHEGYAFEIGYGGESYGILTVHLPPETTASSDGIDLLTELAGDLGLFLYKASVEQELAAREERLDLALKAAGLAVWDWDMQTNEVKRDDTYAEMLGYDPTEMELTYEWWQSILHPEAKELHDQALEEHLAGEADLYECEYRLRTASGEYKWIRNLGKVTDYDEEGNPLRAVGVHQDIDERRRTRDRLDRNTDLLQVIDRVLRHNLKNDMNVINGYARTIRERTEKDLAQQAAKIVETSEELLELTAKERRITDLLANPPPTVEIDLRRVIDSVIDRLEREYPLASIAVEGPSTARARAVRGFEGAIAELLENAVEHTGPTPTVTVEVHVDGETVSLAVIDDGPGIPEMERAVLTDEEAITALYHGSGIGLWLVKLLVEQSDGELAFHENEPLGSIVELELPLAESA
ncbi:MAG: PAS domain S-box protein [Halodesulfurarchaeum sp.]